MARGFSRGGGSSGGGGFSGGGSRGGSFGGGGGGFSFGGGFSRGSSSSSGSYSGHHHHHTPRPRRPWRVPMFGRTVIISTGAQSAFSLFLVVFLIACFVCVTFGRSVGYMNTEIKDQQTLIASYETRDKDYKTLIQGAKNGTYELQYFDISQYYNDYTKTFNFKTYNGNYDPTTPGIYDWDFYRDGQEYFFIVYEYEYNGQVETDWTFVQYTAYQLKDILVKTDHPGEIEIAVGYLTNTESKDDGVYAMNTDYSLEANQEYHYEVWTLENMKADRNNNLWVAIGAGAVAGLIIAGVIFYLVKKYKNAQKQVDADIAKTEAETKLAEEQAKQINRICDYCGASVPDGEDDCPACGSRFFKDK